MAINKGNHISIQWQPGHTALPGNDAVDAAATRSHSLESVDLVPVPFVRADIKILVRQLNHHTALQNWSSPKNQYKPTYKLNPHLQNHLPNGMPRQLETLLHHDRLNAAFTRAFQYKVELATSPNCDICNVEADFTYLLRECVQYRTERLQLINELQNVSPAIKSRKNNESSTKLLHQRTSLKALIKFLQQTGLIDEL